MRNKNRLIAVAALICVVIIGWFVYRYFFTAKITVETSDPQTYVQIVAVTGKSITEADTVATGQGSVSARVAPGTYQVKAYTTALSVSRTVVVKAKGSVTLTLDPPQFSVLEPVVAEGMDYPVIDTSQALYINTDSRRLSRLDSANNLEIVDTEHMYKSAKWQSANYGVLQENNGQFYLYKDGSISQIALPFSVSASSSNGYDIAPNGRLFISSGGDVYATDSAGQLQKFYTTRYDQLTLAASNDNLAVMFSSFAKDEGQVAETRDPELIVLDESGRQIATKKTRVFEGRWSPDGRHLLVRSDHALSVYTKNLRETATVPSNLIGTIAWRTNTDYVFSQGREILSGNLESKQSATLNQISGTTIEATVFSQNGDYLYISSSGNSEGVNHETGRISSGNRQVPEYIQQLSGFLPESVKDCYLNYRNFNGLVITSGYPEGTDPQKCITVARDELLLYDMPVSELTIQAEPLQSD